MVIRTENLRKEYKDVVAVDNLNLEIREGELFSLLGINGAGKTTTIKMLSTLIKPTSGDAKIYEYSILKDENAILPRNFHSKTLNSRRKRGFVCKNKRT